MALYFVQLVQDLFKGFFHFPSAVWWAEQECYHFSYSVFSGHYA
jgi:hypothetical protein